MRTVDRPWESPGVFTCQMTIPLGMICLGTGSRATEWKVSALLSLSFERAVFKANTLESFTCAARAAKFVVVY